MYPQIEMLINVLIVFVVVMIASALVSLFLAWWRSRNG